MQGIEHKTCADTKIPSNKRRINIIYKYVSYKYLYAFGPIVEMLLKTKTNKSPFFSSFSCSYFKTKKYKP